MTARETIPHRIFASAAVHGERVAIRDEAGVETRYREIEPLVRAHAARLIARGVRHGERVALWAPNSAEWILTALGILAAGAVLTPLNTRLKGREAAHILSHSGACMLITAGEFLGVDHAALIAPFDLPGLRHVERLGEMAWLPEAPSEEVEARLAALSPDDLSDILFSSGTTGAPKGAMTTHGQNMALYDIYAERLGLRPGDVNLGANPFFHSFGYKAGWMVALIRGCTILPHAVFDAATILRRIGEEGVTVLPGPPTVYQSLLAQPYEQADISSLRLAITGAAKVPVALIRDMRERLGFETVLTAYGLTENCGLVTMCAPGDPPEVIAGSAGRPVAGVEVRIVDDAGAAVSPGAPGHLHVRGIGVMRGYVDDPESTARAIDLQGWLHTGDIAVADAAGNIAITDRSDDMFTVGGFNVYPAEVESLLCGHPAVLQAAVIAAPDERLGNVPIAFCVLRPGHAIGPEALAGWARAEMANYKLPRRIEIVAELPINASGKVQKYLLREGSR